MLFGPHALDVTNFDIDDIISSSLTGLRNMELWFLSLRYSLKCVFVPGILASTEFPILSKKSLKQLLILSLPVWVTFLYKSFLGSPITLVWNSGALSRDRLEIFGFSKK